MDSFTCRTLFPPFDNVMQWEPHQDVPIHSGPTVNSLLRRWLDTVIMHMQPGKRKPLFPGKCTDFVKTARYLSETFAPPSSSCFLNFSASSLEMFSLTALGEPS